MSLYENSQRVLLFLFLGVTILCEATITGAYQEYLLKNYPKSLSLYQQIYQSDPSNKNALYGVVNVLSAQIKYEEALGWSDTLLQREFDPIMAQKKIWLLGLLNKRKAAHSFWSSCQLQPNITHLQKSALLESAGWGFYGAGNIREALWWFGTAQKINPSPQVEFALQTIQSKQPQQNSSWNSSLFGGPILYSSQNIEEQGKVYGYEGGSFWGGEGSVTFNKKHIITVMWSRFDAKLKEQEYHYEGDTTLYYLYGVNYQDTLYASLNENPSANDLFVKDTFTNTFGQLDTFYLIYTEKLLGEKDSISSDITDQYDRITTVDKSVLWKDTVRSTPDPVWQNSFYSSYQNGLFGGGVSFSRSNMAAMETTLLGWAMVTQKTEWCNIIYNGYYTGTDKLQFFQVSPTLIRGFPKLLFEIEPTYLWKYSGAEQFVIPPRQFSLRTKIVYIGSCFAFSEEIMVGKRSFVAELQGKSQVTVMLPHQFTSSTVFFITPFSKPITFFSSFRFEKYKQMSRLTLLGGVNLSW